MSHHIASIEDGKCHQCVEYREDQEKIITEQTDRVPPSLPSLTCDIRSIPPVCSWMLEPRRYTARAYRGVVMPVIALTVLIVLEAVPGASAGASLLPCLRLRLRLSQCRRTCFRGDRQREREVVMRPDDAYCTQKIFPCYLANLFLCVQGGVRDVFQYACCPS